MEAATKTRAQNTALAQAVTSTTEAPNRVELPVRGELPLWLTGMLLRNGPGKWEFDHAEVNHWFDGMSMLHAFDFNDGRVNYCNRFVRSQAFNALNENGEIGFSEFASDPCRTRFQRIQTLFNAGITDNPNVNVYKFGEQYIALSETPMAIEFDGATLDTLGVAYKNPDMFATAHPHLDHGSGEMINLSCKLGPRSSQSFFRLAPGAKKSKRIHRFSRRLPTYQHSFGMSERWLIFTEFPFVVDPIDIIRSGRPFAANFQYRPARGTRITIVDRETGEVGGEWQAEPGFCFHHINAYEEGDDVVVDLCRFDDASIVQELYLDTLRGGQYTSAAKIRRYRLEPRRARATESEISDTRIELPRINYKFNNCKPYRWVYGVGSSGTDAALDQLVKIDVTDGSAEIWREDNCAIGEPVFVAAPDAVNEDDGVLLSVVLDGDAGRSFLLVLDASDLSEVARAEVSHTIPMGFHGSYVRN